MRGDAVGTGFDRHLRGADGIGPQPAPGISQGRDVIDVNAKAQRRYGHDMLFVQHSSCAGLTRASIFLEKDGLPGQARQRQIDYPLTRSTRATTALARSWAMIALRCLRS